jgi:hypothetical protein
MKNNLYLPYLIAQVLVVLLVRCQNKDQRLHLDGAMTIIASHTKIESIGFNDSILQRKYNN